MGNNSEVGELDPAIDDCMQYKMKFPSVLSFIDKRTKEGCDRGSSQRKRWERASFSNFFLNRLSC